MQHRCVCGGTLRADRGHTKPWVWVCTRCGGGLPVVQANAAARDLDWRKLIDNPWLLGAPLRSGRRAPAAPVDAEWLRSCALVLVRQRAGREAQAYLTRERGIARAVLCAAGVGWDAAAQRLTFPFFRNGEPVAYKTRALGPGAQMLACPGAGRPWPLYPRMPRNEGWVLLVAGELDALRGVSAGLPAVSVPLGAGTWRDEWANDLDGRYVAVCFDNGEDDETLRVLTSLVDAGIRAGRAQLATLGLLDAHKGDLSDYLNAGGDPERLRRRARRAA